MEESKEYGDKIDYMYSEKTSVSQVSNARNRLENQFCRNFKATNMHWQHGWLNIAGGFRKAFQIRKSMKHNRKSRQLQSSQNWLQGTRPKTFEEKFYLQQSQFRNWRWKCSQKFSRKNCIWISNWVKWLCSLWPFLSVLLQLGGTKLKYQSWKCFLKWNENVNWMLFHAENEFQYRKNIHEIFLTKQKLCVFKQELKRLFQRQSVWLGWILPIF